MITSICQECGKEILGKQAVHWCSDDCKIRRGACNKPKTWLIKCDGCGKVFEADKPRVHYCSADCPGRNRPEPVRTLICSDCGKQYVSVGRRKRIRCVECDKKHKSMQVMLARKKKNPHVRIGIGSGNGQHWKDADMTDAERREHRLALRRENYAKKKAMQGAAGCSKIVYRRIAIALHGEACCFCGYSDFPEALETHHRDMDRSNNNADNLFILCSNCHRIVHARISRGLCKYNEDPEGGKQFVLSVFDTTKAEVKQRKKSGTSSSSQSDLKAVRNRSQGQSIPAGEDLPSADTRPLQLQFEL